MPVNRAGVGWFPSIGIIRQLRDMSARDQELRRRVVYVSGETCNLREPSFSLGVQPYVSFQDADQSMAVNRASNLALPLVRTLSGYLRISCKRLGDKID
jgi:hypothetical protein